MKSTIKGPEKRGQKNPSSFTSHNGHDAETPRFNYAKWLNQWKGAHVLQQTNTRGHVYNRQVSESDLRVKLCQLISESEMVSESDLRVKLCKLISGSEMVLSAN